MALWCDPRPSGIAPQILMATLYAMTRFSRSHHLDWAPLVEQHLEAMLSRSEYGLSPTMHAALVSVQADWRHLSQRNLRKV